MKSQHKKVFLWCCYHLKHFNYKTRTFCYIQSIPMISYFYYQKIRFTKDNSKQMRELHGQLVTKYEMMMNLNFYTPDKINPSLCQLCSCWLQPSHSFPLTYMSHHWGLKNITLFYYVTIPEGRGLLTHFINLDISLPASKLRPLKSVEQMSRYVLVSRYIHLFYK